MKEKLNLLAQLTSGKLVDGSGLPVSPQSLVEIGCYPKALELRKRMMEVEDRKWFPQLRRKYREQREQLTTYCGLLEPFLNSVLEKLNTGEYTIKED